MKYKIKKEKLNNGETENVLHVEIEEKDISDNEIIKIAKECYNNFLLEKSCFIEEVDYESKK